MEFPGVFKKGHVQIPGVNKKINGISIGLSFWPWNFQGVSHNLTEFP